MGLNPRDHCWDWTKASRFENQEDDRSFRTTGDRFGTMDQLGAVAINAGFSACARGRQPLRLSLWGRPRETKHQEEHAVGGVFK